MQLSPAGIDRPCRQHAPPGGRCRWCHLPLGGGVRQWRGCSKLGDGAEPATFQAFIDPGARERTRASFRCGSLTKQAAQPDPRRYLVVCIRVECRLCRACVFIGSSRALFGFSLAISVGKRRRLGIPTAVTVRWLGLGGAITLRLRESDPEVASSVLGLDENGLRGRAQAAQIRLAACR